MKRHAALTAAAIVVLLVHAGHYLHIWTDDAFITFRYARHLASGEGLVFNPGEHFEGLTNLGLALLLSLFGDTDLLRPARALGVLSAIGTVALLGRWALKSSVSLMATAAGLISLVAVPWLPYWSVQGMETPIAAFLLTLGWTRYAEERQAGGAPLSAVGLGLAPWIRPDGALVAVVIGIWHALTGSWGRHVKRSVAVVAACGAALVAFKLAVFGDVLPNTFHVKTGSLDRGLQYGLSFFTRPAPWLPALVTLSVLRGLAWAGQRDVRGLPALLALIGFGAVVLQDGDFMANFRLLVPLWPAACAALALAVDDLARRLPTRGPLALLALVGLAAAPHARSGAEDGLDGPEARPSGKTAPLTMPWLDSTWGTGLGGRMPFATAWTLVNAGPDETVAYTDIGLLGFVNDVAVIDLLALTDPVMAGRNGERWPEKWAYLSERVTWMLLDVPDGEWRRYRDELADAGWVLEDGCESVWVLRNPGHTASPPDRLEVERRLEAAVERLPTHVGLHASVTNELARAWPDLVPDHLARIRALPTAEGHPYTGPLDCFEDPSTPGCTPLADSCGTTQARVRPERYPDTESWPKAEDYGLAPQDPEQAPVRPEALVDPNEHPPFGDASNAEGPPEPPEATGPGPTHTISASLPKEQATACAEAVEAASGAWLQTADAWASELGAGRAVAERKARRASAQTRAGVEVAGDAADAALAQALEVGADTDAGRRAIEAHAASDRMTAACTPE
ncbi:MAG: hypothetical protein GY913_24160 [Proteobacteria bacterium]|nr:hypothetical protein [Pseudomonadota bacterium]MCP4920009.1 hypothetical protein [Pseudomonadota bacterium]